MGLPVECVVQQQGGHIEQDVTVTVDNNWDNKNVGVIFWAALYRIAVGIASRAHAEKQRDCNDDLPDYF